MIATAPTYSAARVTPRGIDRLAIRASLAVLLWARRRAERRAGSRELLARRAVIEAARVAREHEFALRLARVR